MLLNRYWDAWLIPFIVSLIATPIAIKIAPKIGAMDIPKDGRRMHKEPVPRFGGIAIYLGFAVAMLRHMPFDQQTFGVFLAATMILILGIIDDIHGMPAKVKLAGQMLCAAVLWFFSLQIRGMANFFGGDYIVFPAWLSFIVTVFWITAIINTINLVDGLDGLAGGISFIACLTIAYITDYRGIPETCYIILAVAGATFAFLIFNFNPAKIFMGDAGSMLLGLLLGSVSLIGDTPTKSITLFAVILPMIILFLPIFDTTFAIIRRVANHRPIMEADKGHIHHRIMAMGFGQKRTVLVLYSISTVMGVAGVLWSMQLKEESLILLAVALTLTAVFLGIGVKSEEDNGEQPEDEGAEGAAKQPENESEENAPQSGEITENISEEK